MDKISRQERSNLMGRIKGKNTKPELCVRKALYGKGYRYRIHLRISSVRPDIVFTKKKIAIFVNGCFWHSHQCIDGLPQSNIGFWRRKFKSNRLRDRRNILFLRKSGWKTITVWECEIKKNLDQVINKIVKNIS